MAEMICGKVARILNPREVIINVGSGKGVTTGMYFDVVRSEDILDPDTSQKIGSIQRATIRLKVTSVQEKMSFASTYRKEEVNVGGLGPNIGILSRTFLPPRWVAKYETFRAEEKTLEDEIERSVKTGDTVVQAVEVTEDALAGG